nr:MAG: hypothetical protein [Microvirus sp.]
MEKKRESAVHANPFRPHPKHSGEKAGTEKTVETTGYRSTKQQVAEYMAAGLQLQTYRSEMYDFEDEKSVDENYTDPTRSPGYDPADASTDLRNAEKRLRDSAAAKKSEEANKKMEEGLNKPPPTKDEEDE